MSFQGNLCGIVNQSVRYVHSCPQLLKQVQTTLVGSSRLGLAEDPRTTDKGADLLRVVARGKGYNEQKPYTM